MRWPILVVALLSIPGLVSVALADEAAKPTADAVQAAFDTFVRAASQTHWPVELEARNALLALGPVIVPKLAEAARGNKEWRVRRSCYDLLTRSFAGDERTADTLLNHGILDQEAGIRYQSAFYLGDLYRLTESVSVTR